MYTVLHRSAATFEHASCYTTSFKQMIDIFKFQAHGLREETIDDWDPQSIQESKDDKCMPADIANGDGCYSDILAEFELN